MNKPKHLTIKNFHNPSGYASHTKLVIENLMRRYNMSIAKDIKIVGIYKDRNSYVFRVRIPSEKNFKYKTDIFYDTIIEFYPLPGTKQDEDKKIDQYGMRVFSNCPSFTFVFTYTYNKMGSLYRKIPVKLYDERALKEPPKTTNPYRLPGIEKSIFYSLRKIYEETKYRKSLIDRKLDKLPEDSKFKFPGDLFSDIKSQRGKVEENLKVDKIKLVKKRKKKARDATIDLKVGKETLASDEFKSGKSSSMASNLKSDMKNKIQNTTALKENNLKKSSFKTNNLKKKK